MSKLPDFVTGVDEAPGLAPFSISDTKGVFYLTGMAGVKDDGDALHFIVQTYSDDVDQLCGVSYYLDKRVLDEAQEPNDVLKLVLNTLFEEIERGGLGSY